MHLIIINVKLSLQWSNKTMQTTKIHSKTKTEAKIHQNMWVKNCLIYIKSMIFCSVFKYFYSHKAVSSRFYNESKY